MGKILWAWIIIPLISRIDDLKNNGLWISSPMHACRAVREFIRSSRVAQLVLLLLVLLMTSMVVGDGVLTPARKVCLTCLSIICMPS